MAVEAAGVKVTQCANSAPSAGGFLSPQSQSVSYKQIYHQSEGNPSPPLIQRNKEEQSATQC